MYVSVMEYSASQSSLFENVMLKEHSPFSVTKKKRFSIKGFSAAKTTLFEVLSSFPVFERPLYALRRFQLQVWSSKITIHAPLIPRATV